MKKKKVLFAGLMLLLILGLTSCGGNKLKGEWTVREVGFDDNGNYSTLTSQTFANATMFPGTTIQFDDKICGIRDESAYIDTYLNYQLQDSTIFLEKDGQDYVYEYEVDGDTLKFSNVVTQQTLDSDGSNTSNADSMSIICTRNSEDGDTDSDETYEETGEDSEYVENNIENDDFYQSDLYDVALEKVDNNIQRWVYDDFDGDGDKEVFVATGNDDDYDTENGVKSLWFIESNGDATCVINKAQYWYFTEDVMTFDNCKLLYIPAHHGIYEILGVKDDRLVSVSYPENYGFYWIDQEEGSGEVTAAAKREQNAHILEFDYDDMAFYDTGDTIYIGE